MSVNTNSIDFESGSSQYLSITDASQTGLDITGDMTFECWFKPESSPASGAVMTLCSKYGVAGGGANQRSYQFNYFNNAGTYQAGMNNSSDGTGAGAAAAYVTTGQLTEGSWTHLAWVYTASSGQVEIYVNGSSVGTNTGLQTSIFNGTALFVLGAATEGTSNYVDGLVDECRVWNDVRTGVEIAANMSVQLVGNEAGLQGYWQLNNDLLDLTANNNDLTNNNAAVFSTDVPFGGPANGRSPSGGVSIGSPMFY